jgi:hypothetical protein
MANVFDSRASADDSVLWQQAQGYEFIKVNDHMVAINRLSPLTLDTGLEYEIKVKGHLADQWADWLGGLTITRDAAGYSHLTGTIPDQAALHGILAQIRDLGLTLISLLPQRVET